MFGMSTQFVTNWIVWNRTDYLYENEFGIR